MVLRLLRALGMACVVAALSGTAVAAELKPKTVAAFDRYVSLAEARMAAELAGERPFPDSGHRRPRSRARRGWRIFAPAAS